MIALEVLNEIADAVGWPQLDSIESPDQTPEERKMVRALNRVLRALVGMDDWPMLRKEGNALFGIGEWDKASRKYLAAAKVFENSRLEGERLEEVDAKARIPAYLNLAVLLEKGQRQSEALGLLRRALAQNPEETLAEKLRTAIAALEKLVEK